MFHFINVQEPGNATNRELQRRAHAHAARMAHARARIVRTLEHRNRIAADAARAGGDSADSGTRGTYECEKEGGSYGTVIPVPSTATTASLPSPADYISSLRRDMFSSFGTQLKPGEQFLLDNFVTGFLPYMGVQCVLNLHDPPHVIVKAWTDLAFSDPTFLCALYLCACRFLSRSYRGDAKEELYIQLAIRYKLACVQAVKRAIEAERASAFSGYTVIRVLMLALDEMWLGDFVMFVRHLQGAIEMVLKIGGPQALGVDGFAERFLFKFLRHAKFEIRNPLPCGRIMDPNVQLNLTIPTQWSI